MDVKLQVNQFVDQINAFSDFLVSKLKNFKDLTLGEQIAYPTVGLGFILLVVGLVLFVV